MQQEFYQGKYIDTLEHRLDNIETKIDSLNAKVTWIYAWSAGVGTVAAFLLHIILK